MSALSDRRVLATDIRSQNPGRLAHAGRVVSRNLRGVLGAFIIGCVLLVVLLYPLISTRDPIEQNLALRLRPPVGSKQSVPGYPLGTDQLGRDLLIRIIGGAQVSLTVAGVAVMLSTLVGLVVGLLSGYIGGALDQLLNAIVDGQLAFPFLLLAITLAALLQPGLQTVILILVVSGWASLARMLRSQVLAVKEREFVLAARAIGCSHGRVLIKHIFPATINVLIVVVTAQTAEFILAESTLSFLGIGVQPPAASLGRIMNEGRDYIFNAWWLEMLPGAMIVVMMIGFGLLGDWVRDKAEPESMR